MRRLLFRIALFLFLGTVTTVGSTWALAVALNWRTVENHDLHGDGAYQYVRVSMRYRFGGTGCWAWYENERMQERFSRSLLEQPLPQYLRPSPTQAERAKRWEAAAFGWPFHALSCQSEVRLIQNADVDAPEAWGTKIHGAVQIVRPSGAGLLAGKAPLLPVWRGLALDVLLYAALWFGLVWSVCTIGCAIRRRRGCCPKCGYDLRGNIEHNGGCPECWWGRSAGTSWS